MISMILALACAQVSGGVPVTEKVGSITEIVCRYENFRQSINFDIGGKFVNVYRWERENSTQPWYSLRGTYTTSSPIQDVAATHGGDVLYLSMVETTSQVVVEKWIFDVRPGRWIHSPPSQPGPVYLGTTQIKGGGPFQVPSNPIHVAPERSVVYRGGQAMGCVPSIGADPEGRFLILHEANATANKLWKVSLVGESAGSASLLYDCLATEPALAATFSMRVFEQATLKRVWLFTNCPKNLVGVDTIHVLLVDSDNDGSFDSKVDPGAQWDEVEPFKVTTGWRPLSSVAP